MKDKPKIDPLLVDGAPPGTRLRPVEALPAPKGRRRPAKEREKPAGAGTSGSATAMDPGNGEPFATPAPLTTQTTGPVSGELLPPPAERVKSKKELEMEAIARVDHGIRRDASRVLHYSLAAADVPETGIKPEGWSERKWRIARDARMSRREGPAYLDYATKVYESFLRNEALAKREGRVAPALNAQISFYVRGDVNNTYNYPVIELKDDT